MPETNRVTEVIEQIESDISGDDIRIGQVVDHFESRGFGPILLVPAVIAILPTGAIPGVPSVCGILIFLVAMQMCVGMDHPWVPDKLRKVSVEKKKFSKAAGKIKPWTSKLDRFLRPRMTWLAKDPARRVVALVCALLGLCMIPLELLPFAAALPASAIVLASVALVTRDGAAMIASGLLFVFCVLLLVYSFL